MGGCLTANTTDQMLLGLVWGVFGGRSDATRHGMRGCLTANSTDRMHTCSSLFVARYFGSNHGIVCVPMISSSSYMVSYARSLVAEGKIRTLFPRKCIRVLIRIDLSL